MDSHIPVNPEVLKWARISLGLSCKEVALKIHKPEEIITEWEEGVSAPTYSQVENLAYHIYKRPVAVFFFPEVPSEDTPKADFRSLPEIVIDSFPPEIVKLYRKAKVFQINLAELLEGRKPVDPSLLGLFELTNNTEIVSLACAVRQQLEVDVDTQFGWGNIDTAFSEWRNRLEKHGIFIFKDAFGNDEYSGFCLYDTMYPVIFVNNSLPKSRQIFTLFHELAHLLFKSGGIDIQERGFFRKLPTAFSSLEVQCNAFAGEMLLPSQAFQREGLPANEENITKLAHKFNVSREVVLRKYLNHQLIGEEFYCELAEKWIDEAKRKKEMKSTGGDYYNTQKAYLGNTYLNLAFGKYFRNQISAENLADYLGISVKNVPKFENYVLS